MRLGAQPCYLEPGTRAAAAYGVDVVEERHRHRWEVNPTYHEALQAGGMVISGSSQKGRLAEIIELPDHPFFIAGQFHPELRSRPTRPHPLFREFVGASAEQRAAAHRRTHRRRLELRPGRDRADGVPRRLGRRLPPRRGRDWPGIGDYEVIHKHDAVAIVPVTPDGDVVLVRQFRPPVRDDLLEVPAGLLDIEGEDARTCAERELFEETGYRQRGRGLPRGDVPVAGVHRRVHASVLGPDRGGARGRTGGRHRGGAHGRCTRRWRRPATGKVRNATTALALLLAAGDARLAGRGRVPGRRLAAWRTPRPWHAATWST